jgi:hypothetical protein
MIPTFIMEEDAVKGNSIVVGGTVQLGTQVCYLWCLEIIDPLRCDILKP